MSSTPPHLPTYHVRLSDERISAIATAVFPNHEVLSVKQLESGKSYNNRIYFIEVQPSTSGREASEDDGPVRRLVLKIAGHYFDRRKIENELGCLLLIRKFCPDIPAPEPFAWSETGHTLKTVDGRVVETDTDKPFADHAWILMSRLPGRVLTVSDLDSEHGPKLLRTLAGSLTAWRTKIPAPKAWGNLRISAGQKTIDPSTTFQGLLSNETFALGAYLLNNYQWPPTTSWYPMLAQDQLTRLKQEPHFARTWDAFGLEWEHWVTNTLPHYPLCQNNTYVLTHLDFSPRNILVSTNTSTPSPTSSFSTTDTTLHDAESRLRISGMLDFAFSGFFPAEEEFLNATVRQDDDWHPRHWDVIIREMARLGQTVPPIKRPEKGADVAPCYDRAEWEHMHTVAYVIDRLAPWNLMAGKFGEEELREKLDEAAEQVNRGLKKLEELSPRS